MLKIKLRWTAAILIVGACGHALGQAPVEKGPRVFSLNSALLSEQKKDAAGPKQKAILNKVDREAQKAMRAEIMPIVTKSGAPPSGDKHDYMSQAPYFWKNPKTPDGLPYIRRDGDRNPEITKFPDHELMDKMVDAVEKLSLGFYFTGRHEYAEKAEQILRTWFLDAKTRMNPNLEYAQAIPGVNTGRGIGIIETRGLTRVVDAVGLLEGSRTWSKADQKGLEDWFASYLKWLTESKNGRDEAAAKNNHGTFYDVQVVCFALFSGKADFAKNVLETAKEKRIAKQIESDGRQPLELERTKSWSYSTMNLDGLVQLAELGDNLGVDLWSYRTSDGRGIRPAIEFLAPFANGEKKWMYQQIEPMQPEKLYEVMRRAERKYNDTKYKALMAGIPNTADH